MNTVPTLQDLAAYADDRTLAQRMARRFNLAAPADVELVVARCAALHEEGRIDVLGLVDDGDIPGLQGSDFFLATHFVCAVLLQIEAPVERMQRVIDALVTRGAGDMMANEPNGTFRTWCERVPARAKAVLQASAAGDVLARRFLTFALEALNAVKDARDLAMNGAPEERMSAVTALSRMVHPDPAELRETLLTFRKAADAETADTARANLLHGVAALLAAAKTAAGPEEAGVFAKLLSPPDDLVLHQAASVLWRYREAMSPEVIGLLLAALTGVNPNHAGTIKELDLGLQTLLTSGCWAEALSFLEVLLSRADSSLELAAFDSFTHELTNGPPDRLSHAVVRWLVLGERRLCEGLASALGTLDRDRPLALSPGDLARPPDELARLSERAVGFFFLQPTLAASILVAVMGVAPLALAASVEDLLVETVLVNFGGVREYLADLAADDPAKARAESALARNKDYLDALRGVPDIAELRPSEHRREIERLRMSDQMSEAFKAARSQSVLFNLVSRQVILHGNGAFSFITPPNGERRTSEVEMKSMGVSFEMPWLEVVDPVGLDYMIRVLRARRPAA